MDAEGDALSQLPMPVVVVAAAAGPARSCSTATATYVSFEPPLVAVPLSSTGRTARLVRESGELSVSVLADSQAEIAVRAAASSDGDKFAEQGIEALAPPGGRSAPAVAGCVAAFWCDVESTLEAGGHTLFVGRVRQSASTGREPLLRFERLYRALGAVVEVEAEAAYPL